MHYLLFALAATHEVGSLNESPCYMHGEQYHHSTARIDLTGTVILRVADEHIAKFRVNSDTPLMMAQIQTAVVGNGRWHSTCGRSGRSAFAFRETVLRQRFSKSVDAEGEAGSLTARDQFRIAQAQSGTADLHRSCIRNRIEDKFAASSTEVRIGWFDEGPDCQQS